MIEKNGLELSIDLPLLCESLGTLADDVEFIATGNADDNSDYDAWDRRTSGGLQLTRIRAMLNGGELELAAVDLSTLRILRNIWLIIERLHYGSHHDDPASYRGPLFLPHELGPHEATGLKIHLRKADEPFDAYEDFPGYASLDRDGLREAINEARASLDPPREPLNLLLTTTKREEWSYLPDELRRYAKRLGAPYSRQLPEPEAAKVAGVDAGSQEPDGPAGLLGWAYKGEVYDSPGMAPQVHGLASHLFAKLGRSVEFESLVGPGRVFPNEDTDWDNARKHGQLASKWFAVHEIPLKIEANRQIMIMKECLVESEEQENE